MARSSGPPLPYKRIAAITPCPGGWLVASAKLQAATFAPEEPFVLEKFQQVFDEHPPLEVVALGAPIGYLDEPDRLRTCDREARRLLGARRGLAVRRAPCRTTAETGIPEVDEHLDAVSLSMLPRTCEVASELLPYRQRQIYEAHPELSFYVLNGDRPLTRSKYTAEGIVERRQLLLHRVPGVQRVIDARVVGADLAHLHDAAAMLWTARRIFAKAATRLPTDPEWDGEGLRMEIVR